MTYIPVLSTNARGIYNYSMDTYNPVPVYFATLFNADTGYQNHISTSPVIAATASGGQIIEFLIGSLAADNFYPSAYGNACIVVAGSPANAYDGDPNTYCQLTVSGITSEIDYYGLSGGPFPYMQTRAGVINVKARLIGARTGTVHDGSLINAPAFLFYSTDSGSTWTLLASANGGVDTGVQTFTSPTLTDAWLPSVQIKCVLESDTNIYNATVNASAYLYDINFAGG